LLFMCSKAGGCGLNNFMDLHWGCTQGHVILLEFRPSDLWATVHLLANPVRSNPAR
jgi:hypothetical protein